MAKFMVSIDAEATWTYEIEAGSQEEAYEKAEDMISNDPDFYDNYRNDCELMDARVYYDN